MSKPIKTARDDAYGSAPDAVPSNVTLIAGAAPPVRRKRRSRLWFWIPVLVIAAGAASYGWQRYAAAPAAATMLTQAVTRGNIENSVTAVGKLEAVRSVDAGAQVSGQLKTLHVGIGDMVEQDQLIAEMDPASIENRIEINQAELANLQAQLSSRRAQLVLRQANIERQQNLAATSSVSQSILDQAVADLAVAQADLEGIEAQIRKQEATLDGARVDLGYTKIYAPMAGTIVDSLVKEGQTLNASQTAPTIVTIADLSTMTVRAQVSEADVGRLKAGMESYFVLLGQPGKRFTGTLRQIQPTPTTENNVVLYNALFDVPNPDGELMMAMSAQVFFVQAAANDVLVVPNGAIRMSRGGGDAGSGHARQADVTVVTASGATETRGVETGIRDRINAEIRSGLSEGDLVVVDQASQADRSARRASRPQRGIRMPSMF